MEKFGTVHSYDDDLDPIFLIISLTLPSLTLALNRSTTANLITGLP